MGKQGYSGISFPFRFNGRGGVATSTTSHLDYTHIKEGLQQILSTGIGERVMELEFGSEVAKSQFADTGDLNNMAELKMYIEEAITKWDNRVKLNDVVLEPVETPEGHGYRVSLDITVVKFMQDYNIGAIISEGGVQVD